MKKTVVFTLLFCLCASSILFSKQSAEAFLSYGSVGTSVKQVQTRLVYLGYLDNADGLYGTATEEAVKSFQRDRGLSADGKCGSATMKALGLSSSLSAAKIKALQEKLISLGYYSGTADGLYGAATANAVSEYQREAGLAVDGIAGSATLSSLEMESSPQSEDNLYLLAKMISAEARGESYIGQVSVGAVIMNRIEHPSFPDSLYDVLFQPGAFTAIVDGQWNSEITDSAWSAAQDAMNGIDPTGGAIYYYNPTTATNEWIRTRPVVATYGRHVFCM